MKNIFAIIVSLFMVSAVSAQKMRFDIQFSTGVEDIKKVYIQPCGDSKTVPMRLKGGLFVGTVPASESGFYDAVILKGHSQVIQPIYIGDGDKAAITFEPRDRGFALNNSPENRALSALTYAVSDLDRRLWLDDSQSEEQLKSLILSYQIVLDSIVAANDITGKVADFMTVYAYSHAYNAYSNIPRTQGIMATAVPFSRSDVLPPANVTFDNDFSPMFYTAMQIIRDDLTTSPVLLDKLNSLYGNYKNEAVRQKVASIVMNDFVTNYDYARDFEGGMAIIEKATAEFGLPDVYMNEYMKHKVTIPGSPFPEYVELVDEHGKVVDFSEFKGKYVYIDMWASWCAPCCKEVPSLQKLEKELNNKNVVFVSISCDTDELAWKNKMKEYNMHGNQLLDKENALGDALNVKAIPFFLIYDKNGCLHTYGAKRPSSGTVIKEILEKLK